MRLVYLPTIASKHLDTFLHTFLSTLHMAVRVRPDVAIYFIAGNSPFAALARAFGIPAAINVDGLDSQRAKWGAPARWYLRWAERNAPRLATTVITDSRVVQELYRRELGAETTFIPYGADMDPDPGDHDKTSSRTRSATTRKAAALQRFGLRSRQYILFVGRLVPENNAHVLIDAYRLIDTEMPLVIVGHAPYADKYIASLHQRAAAASTNKKRIVFAGYLFGDSYRELARHCAVFAIPTEVGGTHPVLVEAMAAGACVVVNDHRPNLEVLGDAGVSYPGSAGAPALAAAIGRLLADPLKAESLRQKARERARIHYSWEAVTDAYEALAGSMARSADGSQSTLEGARTTKHNEQCAQ